MRSTSFFPFVLACAGLTFAQGPAPAPADRTSAPPGPQSRQLVDELPNGVRVVIEERHSAPVVHVLAYMKIGSIYEGPYLGSGLSHYMEHIVHGGSTRRQVETPEGLQWRGRTEEECKDLLQSIGGYTNAKTSLNYTQYFITTKNEMAETAVDLISDWLQNCQFDAREVEREQGVVQQELLRNLDDPGRFRGQLYSQTMFQVHPVRVPVIGYRDCIQKLTRDDMMAFYARHYMPENCVVSIVGDVDRYAMLELVKSHFGTWKRKNREPYLLPEEPEQVAPRWVEKEHGSTKTCQVLFGVPTIPLRHPDLYALDMLSNVLGLGEAARLPRKFEHDPSRKPHATGLGTSNYTPVYGCGRFSCGFTTDTLEDARQLVHEIWAEMKKLETELVAQEEIDRALKVLEKYHHMGRAKVDDRAEQLASNLAWLADPNFDDRYLAKIRSVTPEEIQRMARKYLDRTKLNVTIVTPPQPAPEKQAQTEAIAAESDIRKVILDNGLTVLLRKIPDYGMVDVAAAFGGGVIYEDEANNGAFFLMGNTFWRGTQKRSFPQLVQDMEHLGMELGAESHNNVYFVTMRCLSGDLDPAFGILGEVILEPAMDPAWVERFKSLLLHRVLPSQDVQAAAMMEKATRTTLYAKSPYRMERYGTKESVQKLDAAYLRQLYATYTRPNNCVLAIYGDLDVSKTEQLVRDTFGAWEAGEVPAKRSCVEPMPTAPQRIELTNRQVRTNYRIAWRAHSRQEEEQRWAVSVMNTIIGGQGWLHERLRGGTNEYVYAVSARPYAGDLAGHFYIETDYDPADEEEVLAIIDGVIRDVCAGKFSDEELELAKRQIQCFDALGKLENPAVVRGDALSELFGQGYDSEKRIYAGMAKVTREDVIRVANEIFSRPALRIWVRPEQQGER